MLKSMLMAVFVLIPTLASAQEALLGTYQTQIGPNDHFNSSGVRLSDAVAILRQDRANYHRFGVRDYYDDYDPWFGQAAAREVMTNVTWIDAGTADIIVRFTPIVVVSVYGNGNRITSIRVMIPG